jgi:hypothetical protein
MSESNITVGIVPCSLSGLRRFGRSLLLVTLAFAFALPALAPASQAATSPSVDVIEGTLQEGEFILYRVRNLKRGDKLEVHGAGTSGSLDPFVTVTDTSRPLSDLVAELEKRIAKIRAEGRLPQEALSEITAGLMLGWDDDSAEGYDAKLALTIPSDGDYRISFSGGRGLGNIGDVPRATAGAYRLIVALNGTADETAEPSETPFIELDPESPTPAAVQRLPGKVTPEQPTEEYILDELNSGDALYARIEAGDGGPVPRLRLFDYGNKELARAEPHTDNRVATLSYEHEASARSFYIRVEGGEKETTEYVLLLGRNVPQVLTGEAQEFGRALVPSPIEVSVGVVLEQITGVNQREENFGVVANVTMRWRDPDYAFRPDRCDCRRMIFDRSGFQDFLAERNLRWPVFEVSNQQGRRWSQLNVIRVEANGTTQYFERFTATMQAPEFDFRAFPLDRQEFYIRIESFYPRNRYVYVADEDASTLGRKLGEEEWLVTGYETRASNFGETPHFIYRFEAVRHLSYYVLRVVIPISLIILVAWFTFFLKDYAKRIDIAGANLLILVAFNFTISNELPRLGYMTFMDMVLISAFVIGALLIVFNVYLRRQEVLGHKAYVERIDRWIVWFYPLAYVLPVAILYAYSQINPD